MSDIDLKKLQEQANIVDAEVISETKKESSSAEPGVTREATPDAYTEALGLIEFCVTLFAPFYPSLKNVYTAQKQQELAKATVPLVDKYNFTAGAFFEKWGPEIGFAIVAVPLVSDTRKAIKHDIAEKKAAAKAAAEKAKQPAVDPSGMPPL